MAFPTVAGTNTHVDLNVTSHVINLPASIAAGDLLIAKLGYGVTSNTLTWPAGWNAITNGAVEETTGGTEGIEVRYRLADGTEGASITVTSSAQCRSESQSYRITGAADPGTQAPEAANAIGTNSSADSPSLTPTGGAKDYLWLSFVSASRQATANDFTGAPTNYSNLLTAANTTTGVSLTTGASAERQLNAASEDPGAFATGTGLTVAWAAVTLAIHPPASGGSPQTVNPSGLASESALGSVTIQTTITVSISGLASEASIGSPTLVPGPVSVAISGLASEAALGSPTLVPGPVTVSITGLASEAAFGSVTVINVTLVPVSGLASEAALGSVTPIPGGISVSITGLSSEALIGTITIIPGDAPVSVSALASEARIGAPTVTTPGVGGVTITWEKFYHIH